MIFKHPLRKEDGSEYNTEDFFRRLSEENTGHYLLGSYHFWHGGIHFSHGNKEVEAKSDKKEGDAKDNSVEDSSTEESSSSPKKIKIVPHYEPVYAIGEGELIAYRLNKKYKQSTYENRDGETWELDYSTSFCLIKHELEVEKEEPPKATPPTTTTTGTEGTSTTTADAESAEWVLSGNQPHRHLVKNGETLSTIVNKWIETYKTTSATALADIKDLNPQLSEDLSNRAGETILLPDYKILEEEPFASSFPLTTPKEKVVVKLTFYSLYMHLAAYEDYKEKPQTITVTSGNINARNATDVNSVIGTFSKGATLEHQGEEQTVGSNHFVLGKITAGKVVLDNITTAKVGDNVWVSSNHVGFSSNSIDKPPYWEKEGVKPKSVIDEHLETAQGSRDIGLVNPYPTENSPTTANSAPELHNPIPEKPKEPKEPKKLYLQYDSVQTCSIPVTADTLIGHLGRYDILAPYEQNKREVTSKNQLHYEVFTNVSESELNKFLDNEAGLFQDRKFIKLTKGSKIKTTPPEVVISAGEHTLRHDHAIATDTALIVEGNNKQAYYRMILPDGNQSVVGYHPKRDMSSPDIICQHDWRKMGFEIVEESNSNADGLMDLEEMPKFFKDLHKEIDQFGAKGRAGYGDGVITAVELKLALQNHRLRDRWSKLIAYHPSEWRKDNTSIVEAMKGLLTGVKRTLNTLRVKGELKKNVELGKKVLEHEKERMKELAFWEEVPELGAPSVYHFHPIAFVGNVQGNKINITVAMLKKVFEGLKDDNTRDDLLSEIANQINKNAERYKLDTPLRLSHFFAQVRQEIGSKCAIVEDLTYSVEGLKGTFSYFRNNPEEATAYGYSATNPKSSLDQKGIANRAYGNRLGNGNIASEDGWGFRGRGLKHLTGKTNYRDFTTYHRSFWGEDTDFVAGPDLLSTNYIYTVRSGVYFWLQNNLPSIADQGDTAGIVDNITRIINRDTGSYSTRQDHFRRIYKNEKIFENI